MSTKSLDSFASAELGDDALETVSGGAMSTDKVVVASKKDSYSVAQTAHTKEGKMQIASKQVVQTSSKPVAAKKQVSAVAVSKKY